MSNKLEQGTYDHDPYRPSKDGGNYLVKKFSDDLYDYDVAAYAKMQHNSMRINPQSGLSNIFNNSAQQVDFLLSRNPAICHYDKINLYMTIQNNGAALATLLPSHFMIDYIEVLVNSAQVEIIWAHELLFNELYLAKDDEQVINNRARRLFAGGVQGTPYTGPGTLAVAASRTFFVEIPCVFTKTETFIPAVTSDIVFRVHFQPNPLTSGSLATTVNLINCDIMISGREYSQEIKNKLMDRYSKIDHVAGYYQMQRALIPSQALNNSVKTPVKLTEFSGALSSQIIVFLVPANATKENLFNFQLANLIELTRSGMTVSTFQDPPADWLLQQMAELYPTTAVSSQNIYAITQSNTPVDSANYGLSRGQFFMTPNDGLNLTPSISNTYDVYVYCFKYCLVTINRQGQFNMQYVSS